MTPEDSLARIGRERLVMVLRAPTAEVALAAARTAVGAGIRVIEVTFTVPGATDVLAELASTSAADGTLIGAGTVRTPAHVDAALSSGAQFLVSPGLDEDLLGAARSSEVLLLPGILTPTEAMTALALGAPAVKLFPAATVGPGHLRALLGPLPELRVVPTGGIGPGDARQWLDAGALAVGMAGALSPSGHLDEAGVRALHDAATRSLTAVRPDQQADHGSRGAP